MWLSASGFEETLSDRHVTEMVFAFAAATVAVPLLLLLLLLAAVAGGVVGGGGGSGTLDPD